MCTAVREIDGGRACGSFPAEGRGAQCGGRGGLRPSPVEEPIPHDILHGSSKPAKKPSPDGGLTASTIFHPRRCGWTPAAGGREEGFSRKKHYRLTATDLWT